MSNSGLNNRKANLEKWTFSTNGVSTNGLYGIPTIGYGPGKEALAHTPNEKILISDLVNASAYYAIYAYEL